jgi:anti-sigma regulatory factor (Ser/Thr protein kinase)
MTSEAIKKRGQLRNFLLDNIREHPSNIVKIATEKFDVSRQSVNAHLKKLILEGVITAEGGTRDKRYFLNDLNTLKKTYKITPTLAEDVVWRNDIETMLSFLSESVLNAWHYCFTEMFNNAIDHSDGSSITVSLTKTDHNVSIIITDDGVGIFKKIQDKFELLDERHAILELSKGKLTTAPDRHSGEGIFFTSRIAQEFKISSGNTLFTHRNNEFVDWILENKTFRTGTAIFLQIENDSPRILKSIMNEYAPKDEYNFIKTVIPVILAKYGNEQLVSRSQAKRVLARVEKFKIVLLDFSGIYSIGQAFADEIFRVFCSFNPDIRIVSFNTNEDIEAMIKHVQHN